MKSEFTQFCLRGDDDNEHRRFAVYLGDDGDGQVNIGLNDEEKSVLGACCLSRCPVPEERAHQNAEIEPSDMDQVAFVDVLASPQPGSAHAAAIKHMGEAALDHFAALAHGVAPTPDFNRARLA